jgi:arsenate reductase
MKKKIAFICIHNSCRSQMAEAWAKELGKELVDVYSAGTEKYHEIKPLAKKVMEEVGINMDDQFPKLLKDIPQKVDYLITMGCDVECPLIPNIEKEEWQLDDPSNKSIEEYRKTRDIIRNKVEVLIKKIKQIDQNHNIAENKGIF